MLLKTLFLILIFVSLYCINQAIINMKYNELHRILKKNGCYPLGKTQAGHPLWFSPKTGKEFTTSHHEAQEVATGTLRSIKRLAGI